jgi:hypothetical protein
MTVLTLRSPGRIWNPPEEAGTEYHGASAISRVEAQLL